MPVHVDHIAATDPPRPLPTISRIWSAERRLGARTMIVYLNHIQQFRNYCALHGVVEREELTLERVDCFIN